MKATKTIFVAINIASLSECYKRTGVISKQVMNDKRCVFKNVFATRLGLVGVGSKSVVIKSM